jgi:ribosomal protein L37AE/L43A
MVNKTTLTIFDGAGTIFGLDFIINKTSKRECLLCKTNLDKEIGEGKWHIPLCKKHRLKEINKQMKDVLKCRKCGGKITIFAKSMLPCCSKCGSYNYNEEKRGGKR